MASYSVQYIFTLVDRFSPLATKVGASAAAMSKKVHAAGASMSKLTRGATLAAAAVGVLGTAFIVGGVKKAAKFEDAMANVRRVTDITRKEMLDYGKDALRIGVQTAQSGEAIANIMQQGALMGVRGQETLANFAETVAKVSVAWDDITHEEAARGIASIQAKWLADLPPEEGIKRLGEIADAMNELSNRSPFKAPELLKFMEAAGPAGKSFGLTAEQMAAFGGTAMVTGDASGARQGTRAIQTFAKLQQAASSPNKKQAAAIKKLGYGPGQFGGMMQDDPQAFLLDLLGRISKLDPLERTGAITDLVTLKSARQLLSMANNVNEYKRELAVADDEWAKRLATDEPFMKWLREGSAGSKELADQIDRYGRVASRVGSVQKEFGKRTETLSFAWRQFGMAMDRIQISAAMPLLEPLRKIVNYATDAALAIGDFAASSESMNTILQGLGAAGILAMVSGLMSLGVWLTGAASKAALLRSVLMAVFRYSMIGVFLAGLYLIYENFDKIKAAAQDLKQVLDELWNNGKADNGPGSAYYNLNKKLEDTWFGKVAIALGLARPIDDLVGGRGLTSPYDNITNSAAYARAQAASDQARSTYSPFQQMQLYQPGAGNWKNAFFGNDPDFGAHPFSNAQIPQSLNVQAHTSFDPAQITVNVTGQVNSPLQGTGSGTLNARPSRGAATSEAGPGLDVLSTGP